MKAQIKKQLSIFDKVVEAYRNPNNRGMEIGKNSSTCVYFAPAKNKRCKDKMCAVGMNLNKKQLAYAESNSEDAAGLIEELWNVDLIPKEDYLNGQHKDFWNRVQSFHDDSDHFTKHGYSALGNRDISNVKDAITSGEYIRS